jgi:hypothetical protein
MNAGGQTPASLTVALFSIDGFRFAVEAAKVVAMRRHSAATTGDDSPAMEALLGLAHEAGTERRLLVLRRGAGSFTVSVPGDVTLQTLSSAAIHPLPALVAARIAIRSATALAFHDDGLLLLVEPTLMASVG